MCAETIADLNLHLNFKTFFKFKVGTVLKYGYKKKLKETGSLYIQK